MLSRVNSAAVLGIQAFAVKVEVDLQRGLPSFSTVGLPDESVRESRDRVRAAIVNAGFLFPEGRVTVNLAPADLKKEGSGFDLAIAVGLLSAGGLVRLAPAEDLVLVGELSLDGGLKPVRGMLPVAIAARDEGFRGVIVPPENASEAGLVGGLEIYPAGTLLEVAGFLNGTGDIEPFRSPGCEAGTAGEGGPDFAEVHGQELARRALEVSAAGGHNLLMLGPPGAGKTMLARRLPGILPPMSLEESLQTTRIHSVAGLVSHSRPLIRNRPFRNPHHTISYAGLIGGGKYPRPGEVSFSHNGILFLDELPEFSRSVLEVLRQPLEAGEVTISRAAISLTYPAAFVLVAAMNPCPCGYYGDRVRECRCTPREVARYRRKISGPLLDRIDIQIEVRSLEYRELAGRGNGEGTPAIRERVEKARRAQRERFDGRGPSCNARMNAHQVKMVCRVDREGARLLEAAMRNLGLSARGYHKVLKIARTIADLAGEREILSGHLAEAVQYRGIDRHPF